MAMVYFDQYYNAWVLLPQYRQQFEQQLDIIQALSEVVNQKWTEEQITAYNTFLNDFGTYIHQYVFTNQVLYYEYFLMWIEHVKASNPIGYDLYEKQLDYVQKKMTGYDFKNDKKKPKDPNAPKQEPKEKKEKPAEEKERVIIRQGDP